MANFINKDCRCLYHWGRKEGEGVGHNINIIHYKREEEISLRVLCSCEFFHM